MNVSTLLRAGGLIGISVTLSACANWNSAFRKFDVDKGESISIDAKQRVVYSIQKDYGDGKDWRAVCAEPSPDALSALSASLGLDAAAAAKSIGLAFSSQEGAASIGLRTQTIQTLRDSMYRLCEGYASGAIDDVGFTRLQRRYQAVMLGLLAIEQITGAVVARQASLGGNSSARLGQSLAQLTVLVTEARTKSVAALAALDTKNKELDDKKKDAIAKKEALDKVPATAAQADKDAAAKANADAQQAVAKAETAQREAAQALTIAKADLDSLETLRKELDRATAVASTAVAFGPALAASASGSSEQIAQKVVDIVKGVVEFDYTRETCLDTITSRAFRSALNPREITVQGESKTSQPRVPNNQELSLAAVQLSFCAYAIEQASIERLARDQKLTPAVANALGESTRRLLMQLGLSQAETFKSLSPK